MTITSHTSEHLVALILGAFYEISAHFPRWVPRLIPFSSEDSRQTGDGHMNRDGEMKLFISALPKSVEAVQGQPGSLCIARYSTFYKNQDSEV